MSMKKLLAFLPVILVLVIGAFFVWGLNPDRDPNAVPSALVGEPIPNFDLGPIEGVASPGLATSDLAAEGEIRLVNFFASWCVPCRAEHGVLTSLAEKEGLLLFGINYKDKAEDAAAWLVELGNPYRAIGYDNSGRTGLEWGLSGVPETFIIDGKGTIRYRFRGPIVGETALREFKAQLAKVRTE